MLKRQQAFVDKLVGIMKHVAQFSGNRKKKVRFRSSYEVIFRSTSLFSLNRLKLLNRSRPGSARLAPLRPCLMVCDHVSVYVCV